VSKLTTDVVTYCTEASNKKSNMRTGKYCFTKKAHWWEITTRHVQMLWKQVHISQTGSGARSGMVGRAATIQSEIWYGGTIPIRNLVWWHHTNPKFGMVAPYQSDEIWAVDSQENR